MNQIKNFSWILVPLVALGGLFYPLLGLLVLLIMFTLMIVGIINGKYWCGNLCPHGSLFDKIIKKISFSRSIPSFFKSVYLKWGFFLLFMGMFVLRFIRVMDHWGTAKFWSSLGFLFVVQYLIMPTILGISLAYLISPRTWCSFCPMGTIGEVMNKFGEITHLNFYDQKVNITEPEKCAECGVCARACPMELVPYKNFNKNNEFDEVECIKCGECVVNCPLDILKISKSSSSSYSEEQTVNVNN